MTDEKKKIAWLLVSLWLMGLILLFVSPNLWVVVLPFLLTVTFITTSKRVRW